MVVVPAELSDTGQTTMGLRKLIVTNATKTAEGWRIVAQSPNKIVRFLDVDEEGISDTCEPWDDELEQKFGAADPEHNVVLLDNEEPAEPEGEVIDINAAWAERYARAEGFDKRVNELRAPGPAATRNRGFVEAVSEGQAADRTEGVNKSRFSEPLAEGYLARAGAAAYRKAAEKLHARTKAENAAREAKNAEEAREAERHAKS